MDPGLDGIVCAGDLVGVFSWMKVVTSESSGFWCSGLSSGSQAGCRGS